MCVICVKPKGVEMPPSTWIENMWYSNSDGAGFMYADGKKVHIRKGYMKLSAFKDALAELGSPNDLKKMAIVMHFRIGTAGGNIPANTHPFPITDIIPILQKLNCSTKMGIVHNGIIPITPRQSNISDTMEYIASTLAPLFRYDNEFYRSKDILQMISNQTGSKFAFMNPAGEIFTVGSFMEDNGCMFSNASYCSGYWYRRAPIKAYGLSAKDYDDLYDEWHAGSYSQYMDDLMLLDEGYYVVDMQTGDFFDCDLATCFLDSAGFIYVYDDYVQCCYPVSGDYQVFNKEGLTAKFIDEKAAGMLVLDEDISLKDIVDFMDKEEESEKKEPSNGENNLPALPF